MPVPVCVHAGPCRDAVCLVCGLGGRGHCVSLCFVRRALDGWTCVCLVCGWMRIRSMICNCNGYTQDYSVAVTTLLDNTNSMLSSRSINDNDGCARWCVLLAGC